MSKQSVPVGGALQTHFQAWTTITDNPWVLQSVLGHRLEWMKHPPTLSLATPQRRVSLEEEAVLDKEVQDLLEKNAIELSSNWGFFSQLFTVPKKGGGQRPIINLKRLNSFLDIKHFKMEGINTLRDILQERDWMGKLDLSDAYLTVPIHHKDRKYLKFHWRGQSYQFKSLPFGLATAPRTFTKVLHPVVSHLRSMGIRLIIYLDNILILSQSAETLRAHMSTVAQKLESLGFRLNTSKCEWEPTQLIEFLGFLVDSLPMKLSLPESKVYHVQKECRSILGKRMATPRQLARLIGMLTASIPAVMQAPLHYRALQRLRNRSLKNSGYDQQVKIDIESRQDLLWWIHHFPLHNGKYLTTKVADVVITSDASTMGWGATYQNKHAGGPWSRQERKAHINFLELKAAFLALKSFVASRSHMHILLLMDNITAISFINHKGGTHSKVLSDLAIQIWTWCIQRNITLCAEHIPGIDNVGADRESRKQLGLAEWKLNRQLFVKINAKWGPLDVDLFAARHNHQLQRYFSYGPDPEAEAIDALAQDWRNLKRYAFPPFNLLGRCLKKIHQERVQVAVIIAPIWQSQSWYPALLESTMDLPVLLPHSHQILVSPSGQVHPLVMNSSLQLAAWKVSGDLCRLKEFQKKLLISFPSHGDNRQKSRIPQPGRNGWAGVRNGIWIRFQSV